MTSKGQAILVDVQRKWNTAQDKVSKVLTNKRRRRHKRIPNNAKPRTRLQRARLLARRAFGLRLLARFTAGARLGATALLRRGVELGNHPFQFVKILRSRADEQRVSNRLRYHSHLALEP